MIAANERPSAPRGEPSLSDEWTEAVIVMALRMRSAGIMLSVQVEQAYGFRPV